MHNDKKKKKKLDVVKLYIDWNIQSTMQAQKSLHVDCTGHFSQKQIKDANKHIPQQASWRCCSWIGS